MLEKLAPTGGTTLPAKPDSPAKIRDAAAQFEALLLGQLLKSMHGDGSGGWLGTGEDQASTAMLEIADEHLARVLAAQGGLGLANLVVEGLEPKPSAAVSLLNPTECPIR